MDELGDSKEGSKAFLLEVAVVGEHLSDALPAHGLHGDAVGQTVALVGTLLVKAKARKERGAGLGDDENSRRG